MGKIGRYEIEAEIGRGAMGVVYLAHDPRLARRLAVKTYCLPQGLSQDQKAEFHERFLREAQAAARLSHPGIVTVYDAGEDPERDIPFIAMEYVSGKSLKEILEAEGPLSLDRVVAMVIVLAEALHEAHEAGIVHRDIKPANLLVRESDGTVKIADFGVAKLSSSTLTQSGISIGSPAYMSPEQVQGRQVDGRSDLFSLAVILYELLCGQRPFKGEDPTALLYAVVHATPVPITKLAKNMPAGLDRFFDGALAKKPDSRFANGKLFREAFEEGSSNDPCVDVEGTVQEAPALLDHEGRLHDGTPGARPMVPSDPVGRKAKPSRRRALFALATVSFLLVVGWVLVGGKKDAHIKLDARSGIESGTLTLLVDGEEVFEHELSGPQERRGFFKKLLDPEAETFEAWIKVPPGKHEIVAQVLPTGATQEYRDTIVVDLEPGETRRIKLSAGRMFGANLSLRSD